VASVVMLGALCLGGSRRKESEVRSLWRFLIMLVVSMGIWMAIGLGVGCLLHWLVPAIDVGMGMFIGVVTLGGCFLWLSRISTLEAFYGSDDLACNWLQVSIIFITY
jgi:hypothetical protein